MPKDDTRQKVPADEVVYVVGGAVIRCGLKAKMSKQGFAIVPY